ncbi:uncharacterized protein LOC100180204 [Ciona intestinalis]
MKLKVGFNCENKANKFFTVKEQISWRAEKQAVCTDLLKSVPQPLLSSVLSKGGISTAICQALLIIKPSIKATNFQSDNGDVVCDVTGDESFRDDVIQGKTAKTLQFQLRSFRRVHRDKIFKQLTRITVKCTIESPVTSKFSEKDENYENLKKERNTTKQDKVKDDPIGTSKPPPKPTYQSSNSRDKPPPSETSPPPSREKVPRPKHHSSKPKTPPKSGKTPENLFDLFSQFSDMLGQTKEDDTNDFWKRKKYTEALPQLMKELEDTSKDLKDRGVLHLKIGLCLTQVGRARESGNYISDGLAMIKREDTDPGRCEELGDAIKDVAERFSDCRQVRKAIIIIKLAASLYEKVEELRHAYNGLMECNCLLIGMEGADRSIIIKLAEEIHQTIFKLGENKKNPSTVMVRCTSCFNMAALYFGDRAKEVQMYRQAIEMYEEESGSDAKFFSLYGTCLNRLGFLLQMEGKVFEAEEVLTNSLLSMKLANDWKKEANRQKLIDMTERTLVKLRFELSTI